MRKLRLAVIAILFLPFYSLQLLAEVVTDGNGLALQGNDPVTYFSGVPQAGSAVHQMIWGGAVYYFVSAENRSAFAENPNKYQPQFGAHCAYGVRLGQKFAADPNVFAIHNGQLFVLYSESSKQLWNQDRQGNIQIAKRRWPEIKDKSR